MSSYNTTQLLRARTENENSNRRLERQLRMYKHLVQRLGLETELKGHEGCVNCLEWNQDGSILASGSDDLHAILWNPIKRKIIHKISTGHSANIFSVKFMPNSGDTVLATGAGDAQIRVHSVPRQDVIAKFKCHMTRVKRLATTADEPYMIWSASEDGVVRQFDLRRQHTCNGDATCANALIDMTHHVARCEVKCIEVNPCRSELLAIGCSDPYVRLYDRRMLTEHSTNVGANNCSTNTRQKATATFESGCTQYFAPGHLSASARSTRRRSVVCTYLSFSPNGHELLANLGGEQLYLFDINTQRQPLHYTIDYFNKDDKANSSTRNEPTEDSETVRATCSGEKSTGNFLRKRRSQTTSSDRSNSNNGFTKTAKSTTNRDGSACAEGPPELSGHALELKRMANSEYEVKNFWAAINLYGEAITLAPGCSVLYANRAAAFIKRGWYGDFYAALRDCEQSLSCDSMNSKAAYRQTSCLFKLGHYQEAAASLEKFKRSFPDFPVKSLERDINATLFSQGYETPGMQHSISRDISHHHGEKELRRTANDYQLRFCGHCNTATDIKEANFFGANGEYVIAGSDDGSIFLWEKQTQNLLRVLKGDEMIVNCLQPHPSCALLATSGVDHPIRLWSPRPEGTCDERSVPDEEFMEVVQSNQRRMKFDPFEMMMMDYTFIRNYDDEEGEGGEIMPQNCQTS